MELDQALDEAAAFLEQYPATGFDGVQNLVAAAILWGENIGAQHVRTLALQAMSETRTEILDALRAS